MGIKAGASCVTTVVDTRNLIRPCIRAGVLNGAHVPDVDPAPTPLEVLHDGPETSTDGFMSDFTDGEIHVGTYGAPERQEDDRAGRRFAFGDVDHRAEHHRQTQRLHRQDVSK